MPSVTGLGTTFTIPNYTGEVLEITPSETPFFSAIGGLNEQGEVVASTQFESQTQDLGEPEQPEILEGADAPTLTQRTRGKWDNVVQIFQYAFGLSYTRQAATQRLAGLAIGGRTNPVTDELDYQSMLHLKEAARDMNWTFINGVYQNPSDNLTPRKTRGLLAAITTNASTTLEPAQAFTVAASTDSLTANAHGYSNGDAVVLSGLTGATGVVANTRYYVRDVTTNTFKVALTAGGAAIDVTVDGSGSVALAQPLTKVMVLDMIQSVWDTHGIDQDAEPTLMVNATLKRALTKIFITDAGYQEMSRNVAGVAVTQIETDFGRLNIMLERAMPVQTLTFCHLGLCKPAYLPIPDEDGSGTKGLLFVEPLAKTGASSKYQVYSEAGLWHGPESAHAKLEFAQPVAGA